MFTFRIADGSESDTEQWYWLRSSVYLEEGYLTAADLDTDGSYRDKYDDHSVHILATDENKQPVGCVRLIGGERGILQVADLFDLTGLDSRCCEVSACIAIPAHRKSLLTLGLFRAMFEINSDLGYDRAFMIVATEYLEALVDAGIPLAQISHPRYLYNSENVAAKLEVGNMIASLREADARRGGVTVFAEYFERDFTWTLSPPELFANSAAQH